MQICESDLLTEVFVGFDHIGGYTGQIAPAVTNPLSTLPPAARRTLSRDHRNASQPRPAESPAARQTAAVIAKERFHRIAQEAVGPDAALPRSPLFADGLRSQEPITALTSVIKCKTSRWASGNQAISGPANHRAWVVLLSYRPGRTCGVR